MHVVGVGVGFSEKHRAVEFPGEELRAGGGVRTPRIILADGGGLGRLVIYDVQDVGGPRQQRVRGCHLEAACECVRACVRAYVSVHR